MESWRNEQNFADNVKVSEMEMVQFEGMKNTVFDQITFKLLNNETHGHKTKFCVWWISNIYHLWGHIMIKQNILLV